MDKQTRDLKTKESDKFTAESKKLTADAQQLAAEVVALGKEMAALDAMKLKNIAIQENKVTKASKEKTGEISHKDFCADGFNLNQLETEKKDCEKSDLTTKIEDLKMTIETPTKETHGANWLSFRGRDVAPAVLRSRNRLMRDDRGRLRHWFISGRLLQPVLDGHVHRHEGRGHDEGVQRPY